jgi:hypothetical protein
MNIMCPQKLKGPTKFLRHTLDLGTKHSSPFLAPRLSDWIRTVDTRYPGSSQRYFQLTPPPAPPQTCINMCHSGVLSNKLQDCTFLPTESRSCTYVSLHINIPIRHRLTQPSAVPPGFGHSTPPRIPFPRSYYCAFFCIFLKIEICDFPSSFPLFYLLKISNDVGGYLILLLP